jgi:hypothetical protein
MSGLDGDQYMFVSTVLGERAIPLLGSNQQDVTPEITGEGEVVKQPFALDSDSTDGTEQGTEGVETANLLYSTFLLGSGNEQNHTVAVNAAGNAYVAGVTGSPDFPTTPGAFDTTPGSSFSNDAFVTELSADGSSLEFSTFIGGSQNDWATGLVLNDVGHVFIPPAATTAIAIPVPTGRPRVRMPSSPG